MAWKIWKDLWITVPLIRIHEAPCAEEANDFYLRCFVHFLADFYVTSVLAPRAAGWMQDVGGDDVM